MLLPNKSYTEALQTQKPQLEEQARDTISDSLPLGSKDTKLHIKFEFGFRNFANEPDLDNLISSCLDLLAVAGVISNDRWVYCLDGSCKRMNTGTEYTRITIKEFHEDAGVDVSGITKWIEYWAKNCFRTH